MERLKFETPCITSFGDEADGIVMDAVLDRYIPFTFSPFLLLFPIAFIPFLELDWWPPKWIRSLYSQVEDALRGQFRLNFYF